MLVISYWIIIFDDIYRCRWSITRIRIILYLCGFECFPRVFLTFFLYFPYKTTACPLLLGHDWDDFFLFSSSAFVMKCLRHVRNEQNPVVNRNLITRHTQLYLNEIFEDDITPSRSRLDIPFFFSQPTTGPFRFSFRISRMSRVTRNRKYRLGNTVNESMARTSIIPKPYRIIENFWIPSVFEIFISRNVTPAH